MRTSRKKDIASQTIVATAERLFAQHGITQVSLRQIRQEAGSANNFAVQYHFQDRAGLVRAVYERRTPQLEMRRSELLELTKAAGREREPAALLESILRPYSEIVDEDGQRNYAAFQLKLYTVERDPTYMDAIQVPPVTAHISSLLGQSLPHLPDKIYRYRIGSAGVIFMDAMVRLNEGIAPLDVEGMVQEALSLGTAVLTAPYQGLRLEDAVAALAGGAVSETV
ncbi:MAG: helix-turn-helix domain-containing protein [Sphingobium sp.]